MKISYDLEVDALYIRLLEGDYECRTLRLNDEIALNIGPGEALVGIEVLDAKRLLGGGELPGVTLTSARGIIPLTAILGPIRRAAGGGKEMSGLPASRPLRIVPRCSSRLNDFLVKPPSSRSKSDPPAAKYSTSNIPRILPF